MAKSVIEQLAEKEGTTVEEIRAKIPTPEEAMVRSKDIFQYSQEDWDRIQEHRWSQEEPYGEIYKEDMGLFDFLSKPFRPDEPFDESGFSGWYSDIAERSNISPDPDDPRHYYDYRAAYEAGAGLDERKHLPSEFKHDLHPNRFIIGKDLEIYDSKYGRKADLEDMILQAFQRKDYEEKIFE